ncbi:MAG: hypothetical protein BAJALOKI1v1_2500004 [Promethearchaeota archaeon]|nr:MAG: hypothetical protein BAJALOKI1v1_2500004 [Candidatus Lokiarchaeota archaeon]
MVQDMTMLDYQVIKCLFRENRPLKIGQIKKLLDVPHSTLGSCVYRLKSQGYVEYEPYYEVKLTTEGDELAKEILRHKHLIEIFLYRELDLTKEQAHEESERLNLVFSCEVINKICEKFDHPKECPCGETILNSQSCHCQQSII